MAFDTWSPQQYDMFQAEREKPFFDLADMLDDRAGMRVADLGCGTGRLTRALHERLAARETLGIDRSANMLDLKQDRALPPNLRFEVGSIEDFPGARGAFDLIFSNAAFHWVMDHPSLLERLARALASGGQLAFQIPASHDTTTHIVADELAASEPYRSALKGWQRPQPVLAPDEYARLLYRLGFRDPHVRMIVYPHVLARRDDVVEWVKGTLLTEYERQLPAGMFEAFLHDYRSRLMPRLEPTEPYFYPFKRILCWGKLTA